MLKQRLSELWKLNINNRVHNEEPEQYERRLCLRIDGVHSANNESSDDVLKSVKSLFREAKVDIPEAVVDHAHRIGPKNSINHQTKIAKALSAQDNILWSQKEVKERSESKA